VAFILSSQRKDNALAAFQRYRDYLRGVQTHFPVSAFALATADWYFGVNAPGAPHDSHLHSAVISETPQVGFDTIPIISICIRLHSPHGGVIEFTYPQVFRYNLVAGGSSSFHSDWRYDEFRLSDNGHVVHEIEWWHDSETARWLIESSDVQHRYFPSENV
jgi:hypothetical protein